MEKNRQVVNFSANSPFERHTPGYGKKKKQKVKKKGEGRAWIHCGDSNFGKRQEAVVEVSVDKRWVKGCGERESEKRRKGGEEIIIKTLVCEAPNLRGEDT